jgi:hypothetical protein
MKLINWVSDSLKGPDALEENPVVPIGIRKVRRFSD